METVIKAEGYIEDPSGLKAAVKKIAAEVKAEEDFDRIEEQLVKQFKVVPRTPVVTKAAALTDPAKPPETPAKPTKEASHAKS